MTARNQLQRLSVVVPRIIYVNIFPSSEKLTRIEQATIELVNSVFVNSVFVFLLMFGYCR